MTDHQRTFVGFGLGPIQTGIFLHEALRSGFDRLVVAEVSNELVKAVRSAGGSIAINVARADGVRQIRLGPIEIFDPANAADRRSLIEALAGATECATAIPSTRFYTSGGAESIHRLLGRALERRAVERPLVVYAAENDNRAAEILRDAVLEEISAASRPRGREGAVFINTVIGKMSAVIEGREEIASRSIEPLVPGFSRAHLVESFDRILVSRPRRPDGSRIERAIAAFDEKDDLHPFEEAKLFGHNAAHALAAYLALARGAVRMAEIDRLPGVVAFVRAALLEESGAALIRRHGGSDPLFTREGFRAHADDLLARMLNPWLGDLAARVARDPARKLGWDDRLIGAMRLALEEGVRPWRFAAGAAAALGRLALERGLAGPASPRAVLPPLWTDKGPRTDARREEEVLSLIEEAQPIAERFARGGALPLEG